MTKLKTHRGAAKRFKRTGSGGFKRRRAFRNHILAKKSPKSKRQLRVSRLMVRECDAKSVDRLLVGS